MGAPSKAVVLNSQGVTIHTYNIYDWRSFPHSILEDIDFLNKNIVQHLATFLIINFLKKIANFCSRPTCYFSMRPKITLSSQPSWLIFFLYSKESDSKLIVILDDVLLSTMVVIWSNIKHSKAIINLIGHWSGILEMYC